MIDQTDTITVTVDSEVAEKYRSASDMDRRRMDLLVNLHLRDLMGPRRPLEETMQELSREAQERGLTPEILQSILDE
jgi:hypothetical protein